MLFHTGPAADEASAASRLTRDVYRSESSPPTYSLSLQPEGDLVYSG